MTLISEDLNGTTPEADTSNGRRPRTGLNRPMLSLILCMAVCAVLVGASVVLFRIAFSAEDEPAPAVASGGPISVPEEVAAHSHVAEAEEPEALPAPAIAAPKEPTAPVAEAPVPPAIVEPVQPSPEIQSFMNGMEISGMRLSDDGNRIIIDGRVYAAGERIRSFPRLQLITIAPDQLVFRDEKGVIYRKHL